MHNLNRLKEYLGTNILSPVTHSVLTPTLSKTTMAAVNKTVNSNTITRRGKLYIIPIITKVEAWTPLSEVSQASTIYKDDGRSCYQGEEVLVHPRDSFSSWLHVADEQAEELLFERYNSGSCEIGLTIGTDLKKLATLESYASHKVRMWVDGVSYTKLPPEVKATDATIRYMIDDSIVDSSTTNFGATSMGTIDGSPHVIAKMDTRLTRPVECVFSLVINNYRIPLVNSSDIIRILDKGHVAIKGEAVSTILEKMRARDEEVSSVGLTVSKYEISPVSVDAEETFYKMGSVENLITLSSVYPFKLEFSPENAFGLHPTTLTRLLNLGFVGNNVPREVVCSDKPNGKFYAIGYQDDKPVKVITNGLMQGCDTYEVINGSITTKPDAYQLVKPQGIRTYSNGSRTMKVDTDISLYVSHSIDTDEFNDAYVKLLQHASLIDNNALVTMNGNVLTENIHWFKIGSDIQIVTNKFVTDTPKQMVQVLVRPQVGKTGQLALLKGHQVNLYLSNFIGYIAVVDGRRFLTNESSVFPDTSYVSIELPVVAYGKVLGVDSEPEYLNDYITTSYFEIDYDSNIRNDEVIKSPYMYAVVNKFRSHERYMLEALVDKASYLNYVKEFEGMLRNDPITHIPSNILPTVLFGYQNDSESDELFEVLLLNLMHHLELDVKRI